MVKRPTIADLAAAAGVSVATVDRVLNRRLPVRADTERRVLEAAERIGFHATGLLRRRLEQAPALTLGFLLQRRDAFYEAFAESLAAATRAAAAIRGRPIVEFNDDLAPAAIAARLRAIARRCDVVALVAVDHPVVNAAIAEVAARGRPVFLLLSDVTAPSRAGCLMVDRRMSGRLAGWAVTRLARRPGKVGLLIGSHRYLSQETAEISFRSYMRERAPAFTVLEPILNLDDEALTRAAVLDLVTHNRDLVGLVDIGGGAHGLVAALREAGRPLVGVCNELTPVSRQALLDGVIDLVIDTPVREIAREAVAAMGAAALGGGGAGPVQIEVPPRLYLAENV